jgi:hypothetical protein
MTFILFGLTVVASSMNLLVLRFLTMNTEDERREEIQSAVARSSLRFDSDIISPNGRYIETKLFSNFLSSSSLGTLLPSLTPDQFEFLSTELTSAESEPCHCFSCFKRRRKERKKFTVRRMPGKIAHLVPMQRFDPTFLKPTSSMIKPSNTDFHLHSPPITTTLALGVKSSLDDAPMMDWPPPPPFSSSTHLPVHTSTSINSLKPTSVNRNEHDDVLSQTRLQTILSRFQQDLELTPLRLDVKRSSV